MKTNLCLTKNTPEINLTKLKKNSSTLNNSNSNLIFHIENENKTSYNTYNSSKNFLLPKENDDSTVNNNRSIPSFRSFKSISIEKHINKSDPQKKIRKDLFGNIIKKKGSHKISFADDLQVFKNRMGCNYHYSEENQFNVQTLELIIRERKEVKKEDNKKSKEKDRKISRESSALVEIILVESYKKINRKMSFIPLASPEGMIETGFCCQKTCIIM